MGDVSAAGELAAALRELKNRKGRSFEALARRLGTSKSALHRYTAGDALPGQVSIVEQFGRECDATDEEIAELRRLWHVAMARSPEPVPADPPPQARARPWRLLGWAVTVLCVAGAAAGVTLRLTTEGGRDATRNVAASMSAAPVSQAGTCEVRAGVKHVDSRRSGHIWRTDYMCANRAGAGLHAEPDSAQRVAVMETERSWFACWVSGARGPDGRARIWYYTRGDHAEPGADRWDGWGFVAADDLLLDAHPFPSMPECWFAADAQR